MKRKPTFFISDLHIGHKNSIEFDKRPFKDIHHMSRVIVNNYNSIVPEDGICYFLGDIGLTNSDELKKVISQLNSSTKVLILGNHDKGVNAMYNLGFDVVLHGAKLVIAGEIVTMSHCPLLGVWREDTTDMKNSVPGENWHGENRNEQFSFPEHSGFHIHGHIHSGPANKKLRIDNRQMDVGCPANGYKPVSISEIESWIARAKRGEE